MRKTPSYFTDITGKRYGKWFVLERVPNRWRSVMYRCKCDCGIIAIVSKRALVHNKTLSCGCLKNFKSYRNRVLNPHHGARFTEADDFLIRQWYPKTGSQKLKGFLRRSAIAINHRAKVLGVKCKLEREQYFYRRDQWEEWEDKILYEHYPTGGVLACLPFLPNRSKNAIWNRTGRLGIKLEKNIVKEQERLRA